MRNVAMILAAVLVCSAAYAQAPDLTIDSVRLATSMDIVRRNIKPGACALIEGCVENTGKRKLLRFDVAIPNIGTAHLWLGNPYANPDLFVYSPCHGHYHLEGFTSYELLNSAGTVVVAGHKQAFCLADISPFLSGYTPVGFTCGNQGISIGWQDVYSKYLDCQWIDISNVPRGSYLLRVVVNASGAIVESNYTNNVALVPVNISR